MRRGRSPLIFIRSLFEEFPDLSYLRDLPIKKPKRPEQDEGEDRDDQTPTVHHAANMSTPAFAPKAKQRERQGLPASTALPPQAPPPPSREAFHHHETGQPTLAQQTRPDLPSGHERMQRHLERYNDPKAVAHRVKHIGGSANNVFRSQQSNGHEAVIKPVHGMEATHDPEHVGARNQHMYDMLSGMGAHHMAMPNFMGTFHGHDKMHRKIPHPDENDSPEKRRKMARTHAGQASHVIEYSADSKHLHDTSPEERDQVDSHHRLAGAVTHLLSSNSDGHGANIMLKKGPNGKMHPVMFDADIAGESTAQKARRAQYGKETVRSHFLPGGDLAYNHQGQEVGTNYPPGIHATLGEYARGEHFGRHGTSREDALLYQKNAQELLHHGLEKTIQNRHLLNPNTANDVPTRRSDAGKPVQLPKTTV